MEGSLTQIYSRKKYGQVVNEHMHSTSIAPDHFALYRQQSSMSVGELAIVAKALSSHFVFSSLDEQGVRSVVEDMKKYICEAGVVIFEQGSPGDHFYVVTSGECEVQVNSRVVNHITAGQSFGELALLHNSPRTATVRSTTPCELWGINRSSFTGAIRAVSKANYAENFDFIQSVVMFKALNFSEQDSLVQCLTQQTFSRGQRIVNEGDPGDLFYLIKEGSVVCTQGGKEVRRLHRGDYFGEQALLYNCRRTATKAAVDGQVKCLSIDRAKLEQLLGSQLQQVISRNSIMMIMQRSPYLSKLSNEQKVKLIDAMTISTYTKGSNVVKPGTFKGARLMIILNGALKHRHSSKIYANSLSCLGDKFIMHPLEVKYKKNLVAAGETDVAEISRTSVETLLGAGVRQVSEINALVDVLKRSEIFRGLAVSQLIKICRVRTKQNLRQVRFSDGQLIFEQGSTGFAFFIIYEGNVDIIKDGVKVRTITKLDYFGERSTLFHEARSATTVAQGKVVCWTISQEEFMAVVDHKIISHLKTRIEYQDEKAQLNELIPVKVLGRGKFGVVALVFSRHKSHLYALKAISRSKIDEFSLYNNILIERQVLSQLDHIFILKLVRTYKDDLFIYLLCEHVNGVDLFDALRMMNSVTDSDAKFFVASLLIILAYVHERNIVYRDLKPENVMVDELGYLKLIDFGTAKVLNGRTFTIIGTPYYMAPEVILNKGYGTAVDYWSLGVMLYEFVCGKLPFGNDLENPFEVYETILENRLTYPCVFTRTGRQHTMGMIEVLLDRDPSRRGSAESLKANPWLADFEWVSDRQDKLLDKSMRAPYVPAPSKYVGAIEAAMMKKVKVQQFLYVRPTQQLDTQAGYRKAREVGPSGWDSEF
jgi:cGMP-dependent protein kinase